MTRRRRRWLAASSRHFKRETITRRFETENGSNNLPKLTPLKNLWNLCSLRWHVDVSPMGCLLVRLNYDQDPRELEGGQFGWVVRCRRGQVVHLGSTSCCRKWGWKSARDEKAEGGRRPGGCTLKVQICCWLVATKFQNKTSTPLPASHHISKYLCHSYSTHQYS